MDLDGKRLWDAEALVINEQRQPSRAGGVPLHGVQESQLQKLKNRQVQSRVCKRLNTSTVCEDGLG